MDTWVRVRDGGVRTLKLGEATFDAVTWLGPEERIGDNFSPVRRLGSVSTASGVPCTRAGFVTRELQDVVAGNRMVQHGITTRRGAKVA